MLRMMINPNQRSVTCATCGQEFYLDCRTFELVTHRDDCPGKPEGDHEEDHA